MIGSEIGTLQTIDGREVVVVDQAETGLALFGPYLPLEPGPYTVEITIEPAPGAPPEACCAMVDVAGDHGRDVIGKRLVSVAELTRAHGKIRIPFTVSTSSEYEFRVQVLGVCGLTIWADRPVTPRPEPDGAVEEFAAAGLKDGPDRNTRDMIVLVGDSVLGHWVADIVEEAVVRSGGQADLLRTDHAGPIEAIGRADGHPRVLLVQVPGADIVGAIAAGTVPVLAVIDDPADSVRFTQDSNAMGLIDALQRQSACACAHFLLVDHRSALLIRRGAQDTARAIAADILQHLRLPGTRGAAIILDSFGGPEQSPVTLTSALQARGRHYAPLAQISRRMSADEASMIRGALSPLLLSALTRDFGAVTWRRHVFRFGDAPNTVLPPVADATGPSRIIAYGPYLHLPAGLWRARFLVAFSPEVRNETFRLKILCRQDRIAEIEMKPAGGGAFECVFTLRHIHAERWIEIQFATVEALIDGHVAVGHLEFQAITEQQQAAPGKVADQPGLHPSSLLSRKRLARLFKRAG